MRFNFKYFFLVFLFFQSEVKPISKSKSTESEQAKSEKIIKEMLKEWIKFYKSAVKSNHPNPPTAQP